MQKSCINNYNYKLYNNNEKRNTLSMQDREAITTRYPYPGSTTVSGSIGPISSYDDMYHHIYDEHPSYI